MSDAELAALYEQYGYLVHRRCLRLLRSQAEADDALQEVFVRVLRYHREQVERSMLGWLYGIAANVCYDQLKRRARHQPAGDVEALPGRAAEAEAVDPDRRAVVGAVLRQLDARTREIGVRHYLDGMTQEEVAAHTGYSRKTIGKKLQLFEEQFRKLYLRAGGR